MVREGRVFDSLNLKPVFGVGYSVVVYEPGAEVATASSGTTIDVQPGHGLASGDYVIADLDTTTFRRVLSTTSTTVEVSANLPVAAGQFLVNLGADGGVSGPDFQGSGATIYTDSGYATEAVDSHVRTGIDGRYRYWHQGIIVWEVILGELQEPLAIIFEATTGSLFTSNTSQIQSYIGGSLPTGFTSYSGARGVYVNKPSTENRAMEFAFFRDGIERWAYGEDFYPGDRSYIVPIYSDKAVTSGSGWGPGDMFSVCWGGAELDLGATSPRVPGQDGCDGPKFRFNSFFVPSSNLNTYSGSYQYEFYSPSRQTSGTGIHSALFSSIRDANGLQVDFDSGGVQINVSGARAGLTLINESLAGNTRKAYIAAGSGGTEGFAFGVDIPATDTQNWSIYDYTATAYRFYIGPTGYIGIGTGAAIGSDFITGLFTQNAATKLKIDNQSAGNAARAGFTATSDVAFVTLEAYSSTLTDAAYRGDAMVYSTGAGAALHLGTAGVKRVTILDTAAKVGIGIDPPVEALQVVGCVAATGDAVSGVASYITYTGTSNIAAAGATFTVKGVSGATARNSDGWIKIWVGTTAYFIPVWATITG